MNLIKVKHFGPIKDGYSDNDGWMDIRKVTLFIGNQGSGTYGFILKVQATIDIK